jgi:hypothetical protein
MFRIMGWDHALESVCAGACCALSRGRNPDDVPWLACRETLSIGTTTFLLTVVRRNLAQEVNSESSQTSGLIRCFKRLLIA